MRKIVFKMFTFIFAAVIISSFSLPVFAADTFVKDIPGYLSQDELAEMQNKTQALSDQTGFNIGIVMTEDIEGKTPMAYSDDLYDETFGINTNGFLLLINNDTKEDWISTSGEAILYYDDNRISSIHQASKQFIIDAQYYNALDTYLASFANYYNEGIPQSNSDYTVNDNGEYVEAANVNDNLSMAFLIGIAAGVITIVVIIRRYKFHTTPNVLTYLDQKETAFRDRSDVFLRQYTTSQKISTDSGGGGSSTHTSSGGGSHGGGGSSR